MEEETGIAFGTDLPDNSTLSALLNFGDSSSQEVAFQPRHSFLLRHVASALKQGREEIELTEEDIAALEVRNPLPLPDAFGLHCEIASKSEEAIARGDFQLVVGGVSGPPGVRQDARFCRGDQQLRQAVEQHLRAEEACRPDAIFAEVVHLPEGRHAGVVSRPVLRRYEIPFLARSGAPHDHQIHVGDLTVSVAGGHIVLRSVSLDKEVLPRVTSAHNPLWARNVALYRFFHAVASQGVASALSWDWGPLAAAPELPRVRWGKIVLAPRQWRITQAETSEIGPADDDVAQWCRKRGLPRFVGLDGLVVDLSQPLGRRMLISATSPSGTKVTEDVAAPDRLWMKGPEGRFVHNLVIPFVSTRTRTAPPRSRSTKEVRRTFAPGTEWLFAKIYTGVATADRLLCGPLRNFVATIRKTGVSLGWFFIRYADPDWHIR